ncbi:unnamed protein product [Ceutorhynchus assimilis]|uniref:Uncharacterized protein n=1 Tax=Ceutorhynchus assimilis TaxID=467358 RepID=A0A9N9MU51_9CUCU|nr:unnamed protein product [Ceutorhynchus assimilis]
MKSFPSTSSNCGSFIMMALAALLVLEITSTIVAAYPASYSGYYSPLGLEEQNPGYVNLQQAIARLRQAFIDNNELENKNNVEQSITDLIELNKVAFDVWFGNYLEKIRMRSDENDDKHMEAKRSQIAEVRGTQLDRFTLDGTLKRTADFGSDRGHTGQKEYAIRYWSHLG